MWRVKDTKLGAVIIPEDLIKCPICGSILLLHDFRCYYHRGIELRHCDIHMKCPRCGFFATFGVPISEEEFRKLSSSPLHGKVLREELVKVWGEIWFR